MRKILEKFSGLRPKKLIIAQEEQEEGPAGIGTEEAGDYYESDEEDGADDAYGEEEDGEEEEAGGEEAGESEPDDEWPAEEFEEGQLSIDVYQTPKTIVVKSTIAGVKPEDIDISINNDMLTIRGKREHEETVRDEDYLFRECYWGSFSRSIILPVEVEADKVDAALENGVLTVTLPKAKNAQQIQIKVKEK